MRGAPGPSPDRLSETVFSADSVVVRRRDQPPGGRAAGTLAEFGKAAGGASRHAAQVLSRAQLPLPGTPRSEEHTSELQSHLNLVCRLLLEKKKLNCHTDTVD